jgi:hypothetical protein
VTSHQTALDSSIRDPDSFEIRGLEVVGESDYKRTITALERELARLREELLPDMPVSPTDRENQRTVWIKLDRITSYLAKIRERALGL